MTIKPSAMPSTSDPERFTHKDRRERRKLIADAVRTGRTIGQVAKAFGVTTFTVRAACEENQVEIADKRFKSVNTAPESVNSNSQSAA